jgi:SAM-dependent methyltransferase
MTYDETRSIVQMSGQAGLVETAAAPGTLEGMADEVMDWDSAYREQGRFEGPPPWNIGEPQPELAALVAAGKFRSDVLDAGCGYAELSLALAADGYTVVGVDLTPTAVAAANRAAQERALNTASFVQADITAFGGYDGRFNTVVDSTLFHSLPVEDRDGYLQSVHRAAADGANYFVLVFAKGAFPAEWETKPNEVDEDELRDAVSKHWQVDEIRPAFIHANVPPAPPDSDVPMPTHDRDEKGRMKLPAYLLSAHKGG